MYQCQDCHNYFFQPKSVTERHELTSPPYEHLRICPICGSSTFRVVPVKYCRCCGVRLPRGTENYCNEECHRRDTYLREREKQRRQKQYNHPLSQLIRNTEEYNRANGTHYSYGQYVALIQPEEMISHDK